MKTVAILTDFGNKEPFTGVMKGVILKYYKDVTFIDLTNEIEPHDILKSAFWIEKSYRYFPEGTIFLCVVDPGVGGKRKGIVLFKNNYIFIGPDNGIFTLLFKGKFDLFEIIYEREKVSKTFHGRDVFAVCAGKILRGDKRKDFLKPLKKYKKIKFPKPFKRKNKIYGHVLFCDRFGNIITDIPNKWIKGKETLLIKDKKIKFAETFSEVKKGEFLFYKGSFGNIEIGKREGNAYKDLKVKGGEKITIFEFPPHLFYNKTHG